MFFVEYPKIFSTSGHAVVNLKDREHKYLNIYVKEIARQFVQKITQCLLIRAGVVWRQVLQVAKSTSCDKNWGLLNPQIKIYHQI